MITAFLSTYVEKKHPPKKADALLLYERLKELI
jgi:hypothetical protein